MSPGAEAASGTCLVSVPEWKQISSFAHHFVRRACFWVVKNNRAGTEQGESGRLEQVVEQLYLC